MTHRPLTMPDVLTDADAGRTDTPPPPPHRLRVGQRLLLLLAGAVIGLGVVWWVLREPMEELTADNLAAAQARWESTGVHSYDLLFDIQPPGRSAPDRYTVTVRDGQVLAVRSTEVQVTIDEPESYTVDGLFDILERELKLSLDPTGPLASQDGRTFLRVRFNAELGYPERYLRVIGGTNRSSLFIVRELRPAATD